MFLGVYQDCIWPVFQLFSYLGAKLPNTFLAFFLGFSLYVGFLSPLLFGLSWVSLYPFQAGVGE